jgi:tRNA-dihydrouridine synthase B
LAIEIGPHRLRNPVVLAPMAGVTDAPFRALAWRFGAGYVVSEMVASGARLWATPKSRLRRLSPPEIRPVAVQIAGGDPTVIAEAAIRHWRAGADIVDINFGCPAKKVFRKAAGSALLADETLVARIIRAAVDAVPIPITVKIRTGFSPARRNGVEIARIAEAEGARAIAVHGRTRACRFVGQVDYETIGRIKAAVNIPVLANGDIASQEEAAAVRAGTGADGVMIGRAALGAPWLPGQIAGVTAELSLAEKLGVMREHLAAGQAFYGDAGVRIMRKHIQWYLEKLTELGDQHYRRGLTKAFNGLADAASQRAFLDRLHPDMAA